MKHYRFYRKKPSDKVWWVDDHEQLGVWLFSFDKVKVYNLFADYPYKLTEEEVKIFDSENPYWANFFKERK